MEGITFSESLFFSNSKGVPGAKAMLEAIQPTVEVSKLETAAIDSVESENDEESSTVKAEKAHLALLQLRPWPPSTINGSSVFHIGGRRTSEGGTGS
ncbi:hypothetical protein M569_10836 [Genlisea aurea]|uniref:Uncharacterized protein n=1 Tax=Genlisea aurea TaxID=192259 RepID=S8DVL9_9LAMI|nr:hypothetical protein M569_10836 [Genlisea aurea]